MQNFILMDVLKSHTDLDEEFPNFFLFDKLFILLLEKEAEITPITKLHQNIEIIIFSKRLIVTHYKWML